MFAVVNHLHFAKPVESFRSIVERDGLPLLSSYDGFKGFHFVKAAEDRAIVIIFWRDAACAEAAAKSFGPAWFAVHLKPYFAEPEQRSIGEVIVSSL
ncbi:MAG TPA: hypothetical protein VMT35_11460 [Ignavibacteriaceae bacterium]|nr:hypothetical protein [Ignavibacteriaceae bacterium]